MQRLLRLLAVASTDGERAVQLPLPRLAPQVAKPSEPPADHVLSGVASLRRCLLVNVVDPPDFLRMLNHRNVEIDHHRLLAAAYQHA